jgi:hypothetical protein
LAKPAYETPTRTAGANGVKSTIKPSSLCYQNGDSIDLPEIATDSEDSEDEVAKRFSIPDWAIQTTMDPASVFGHPGEVKLDEVFKNTEHTSSAETTWLVRLHQQLIVLLANTIPQNGKHVAWAPLSQDEPESPCPVPPTASRKSLPSLTNSASIPLHKLPTPSHEGTRQDVTGATNNALGLAPRPGNEGHNIQCGPVTPCSEKRKTHNGPIESLSTITNSASTKVTNATSSPSPYTQINGTSKRRRNREPPGSLSNSQWRGDGAAGPEFTRSAGKRRKGENYTKSHQLFTTEYFGRITLPPKNEASCLNITYSATILTGS